MASPSFYPQHHSLNLGNPPFDFSDPETRARICCQICARNPQTGGHGGDGDGHGAWGGAARTQYPVGCQNCEHRGIGGPGPRRTGWSRRFQASPRVLRRLLQGIHASPPVQDWGIRAGKRFRIRILASVVAGGTRVRILCQAWEGGCQVRAGSVRARGRRERGGGGRRERG